MNKYTVLLLVGLVLLAGSNGNQKLHATFIGGIILVLGSLVCYLRTKKTEGNNNWLWLEIIALIILVYFIAISCISGAWYLYPVSNLLPSVVVAICYFDALSNSKKRLVAAKQKQTAKLEKRIKVLGKKQKAHK